MRVRPELCVAPRQTIFGWRVSIPMMAVPRYGTSMAGSGFAAAQDYGYAEAVFCVANPRFLRPDTLGVRGWTRCECTSAGAGSTAFQGRPTKRGVLPVARWSRLFPRGHGRMRSVP